MITLTVRTFKFVGLLVLLDITIGLLVLPSTDWTGHFPITVSTNMVILITVVALDHSGPYIIHLESMNNVSDTNLRPQGLL